VLAVLLFGPPGAGKGTQAASVAAAIGVPHIATGDMFREHMRSGSALGVLARSYLDSGTLVPDEVTVDMLADRISQADAAGGFVLDGYPRNIEQAVVLDRMLAQRSAAVSGVLDIEVPEDELVARLAGRLVCRAASHPYHRLYAPPRVPGVCDIDGSELYQRDDDAEDVVRKRVAIFERDTMPVREHYRALGTPVVTIDGARVPEAVEADLTAAVRALGET
jgi:adenylate kinase